MIRTQVYLDENIYRDLISLAKREKISMAKAAREILYEGLRKRKNTDLSGKHVLRKLLEMQITEGPKDLSSNINHYLYGAKKNH